MSRGFKIAVVVFIVLIPALLVLDFILPGLSALVYLLVGWASFIGNVLPNIEVSWSGIATLLLLLGLIGAIGHGFCGWLWRGTGHPDPWKPRWTASGIGFVVILFAAGMAFTGVAHQTGWLLFGPEPMTQSSFSNDRSAAVGLKTFASAQADFRGNDRDNNKELDYWRADIAGLYTTEVEGHAIKLIELSMATADDRPKSNIQKYADRRPKAGYWYRALLHADEKEQEPDPYRFAACSYPSTPTAGRYMFIICEDNSVRRKLFEGEPPSVFPKNPMAEGWSTLD